MENLAVRRCEDTKLTEVGTDVKNAGNHGSKETDGKTVENVTKFGARERHVFIENLLKKIEEDNRRLLQKQKERLDRVGLELPTVEVRYHNLSVHAESLVVHVRHLPTLWNTLKSIFSAITTIIAHNPQENKIKILQDVHGVIKPSRLTLLLGPPGCGKTTLLLALAGRLDQSLKVTGDISYNGYKLDEFVPQKTSAYVSQYDLHISEMTVRESLDFAARCQGIGSRAGSSIVLLNITNAKLYRQEIAVEGLKRTLQTDYILKILGLDTCADTIVGDPMRRGISGGQKKRLTTGEMIIGPAKVLFMDEISTGLDSSTTFQIVTCLQQWTHITGSTIVVSLLQPAPETFDLFDDIILMSEGQTLYHGPTSDILEFFEQCSFKCPPRKGVADFLQEVVSRKDQAQYWSSKDQAYTYVSAADFRNRFKEFHVGQNLNEQLRQPFDKTEFHKNALSINIYSVRKWELLKACMAREWLLMKRNSFVHVFKSAQLVVIAFITMTVFIRTRMNIDAIHANYYMSSLFYSLIRLMCNGIAELSMTVSRLAVFYKHRDFYFYPAWTYSIPAAILKIPFSLLDAFIWTALTYYVIGYSPELERFFRQFLLLFVLHQVSISSFRFIASVFRNPSVTASFGVFSLLLMALFGGFIIPRPSLPAWLEWGFWLSPLAYAEIGVSVNEFLAPRWQKLASPNATKGLLTDHSSYQQKLSSSSATVGQQVLINLGLNYGGYYYWISIGALVGFWMVFNIGFTCALSYLKRRSRTVSNLEQKNNFCNAFEDKPPQNTSSKASEEEKQSVLANELKDADNKHSPYSSWLMQHYFVDSSGMVLPFEPMTITFEKVQYFVDIPKKMRRQGSEQKRLQLLQDVTGAFRPGVLTALMGVSGAGKTTLLDVLSGRKTGGVIIGDVRIGGHPKVQETYARISGYCEQTDIHSSQITVKESLAYSAWLRLPPQIHQRTKSDFVAEVLQMIELDDIKDALVGFPGVSGISLEQRKRLTIAVELVSNPSIIFMDEPTSGLDARAAAIVMRVVKNIANTRRTVVCTIHQPSIDIFEAFDEDIPGVPKIQDNYNPATWMLKVTGSSAEAQLGLDFAHLYNQSHLYRETKELVRELSSPAQGSKVLQFSTCFPQDGWDQFKACLWKQNLSYWRNPRYNLARFAFITAASLLLGAVLWQKGKRIYDEQDLFNILGSMFIFLLFLGISNCSSVQSIIATERTIVYRERFAGMYSSSAYAFAQVATEIPYVLLQAVIFVIITYPAIDFHLSLDKVFWYFCTMFCTMLYFTYLGMLLVAVTPNLQVASVLTSFIYTMFTMFSGFLIPGPKMPKWWVWCYWICPGTWSLRGFLASQYGDIDTHITVHGESVEIKAFLRSYFGYQHDDLGYIALVLISFPLVFASVFAYFIAKVNFQKR
ncbi:hypothetical protein RJ640_021668 [Escallonia rubra]|uniref:ABC transporter domain-containing protein n=1 Tax=Escallonia rubra TaxID=112253 RepID=A0AA88UCI5_9ASTE|nr:hypothetical protein RJ640_021668 [Escallonia rubra]